MHRFIRDIGSSQVKLDAGDKDISDETLRKIAKYIKSAGFYNQKSKYLYNLAKYFIENNLKGKNFEQLRKELLKVKGVGPETADSILLYALEKPVFVIDEYTRRLAKKHGISSNPDYNRLQNLFENNINKDYRLYQDLHALIVIDGKKK